MIYTANTLNQYTTVGSTAQTYDANGNLTNDGTTTFTYDEENRLTTATKTGLTAGYGYDAFNRRISKTVNGTTEYFIYDNEDIIEDRTSTGTLTADYVHGSRIDEILTMTRSSNTYYHHHDALGSVTEITNNSGTVIESYSYDVYGQPSVVTSAIGNRYRFTGREYDEETGLYHYRNRTYSPTLGRFLQRDPIGYYDSMNLFQYVLNSPVNWRDPFGLTSFTINSTPIEGSGGFSPYEPGWEPWNRADLGGKEGMFDEYLKPRLKNPNKKGSGEKESNGEFDWDACLGTMGPELIDGLTGLGPEIQAMKKLSPKQYARLTGKWGKRFVPFVGWLVTVAEVFKAGKSGYDAGKGQKNLKKNSYLRDDE